MCEERRTYPVGTVLWNMVGRRRNGKVYWAAEANCIQVSHEKGFLFDQSLADSTHGNTWGNIGKNYHLSREECLAAWGEKPLVVNDDRPVEEQESPDPKEYGKLVIWLGDDTNTVFINVGFDKAPFSADTLEWNINEETAKMLGGEKGGYYLTLDEIAEQINKTIQGAIIEVRVEGPNGGVIHQVGNRLGGLWHKHGTTRGYA